MTGTITQFKRKDIRNLITTINKLCGERQLDAPTEEQVFEMWWPKLEQDINRIMERHKDTSSVEVRSDREVLEEILSLSRLMAKQNSDHRRKELSDRMKVFSKILQRTERPLPDGNIKGFDGGGHDIHSMQSIELMKDLGDEKEKVGNMEDKQLESYEGTIQNSINSAMQNDSTYRNDWEVLKIIRAEKNRRRIDEENSLSWRK